MTQFRWFGDWKRKRKRRQRGTSNSSNIELESPTYSSRSSSSSSQLTSPTRDIRRLYYDSTDVDIDDEEQDMVNIDSELPFNLKGAYQQAVGRLLDAIPSGSNTPAHAIGLSRRESVDTIRTNGSSSSTPMNDLYHLLDKQVRENNDEKGVEESDYLEEQELQCKLTFPNSEESNYKNDIGSQAQHLESGKPLNENIVVDSHRHKQSTTQGDILRNDDRLLSNSSLRQSNQLELSSQDSTCLEADKVNSLQFEPINATEVSDDNSNLDSHHQEVNESHLPAEPNPLEIAKTRDSYSMLEDGPGVEQKMLHSEKIQNDDSLPSQVDDGARTKAPILFFKLEQEMTLNENLLSNFPDDKESKKNESSSSSIQYPCHEDIVFSNASSPNPQKLENEDVPNHDSRKVRSDEYHLSPHENQPGTGQLLDESRFEGTNSIKPIANENQTEETCCSPENHENDLKASNLVDEPSLYHVEDSESVAESKGIADNDSNSNFTLEDNIGDLGDYQHHVVCLGGDSDDDSNSEDLATHEKSELCSDSSKLQILVTEAESSPEELNNDSSILTVKAIENKSVFDFEISNAEVIKEEPLLVEVEEVVIAEEEKSSFVESALDHQGYQNSSLLPDHEENNFPPIQIVDPDKLLDVGALGEISISESHDSSMLTVKAIESEPSFDFDITDGKVLSEEEMLEEFDQVIETDDVFIIDQTVNVINLTMDCSHSANSNSIDAESGNVDESKSTQSLAEEKHIIRELPSDVCESQKSIQVVSNSEIDSPIPDKSQKEPSNCPKEDTYESFPNDLFPAAEVSHLYVVPLSASTAADQSPISKDNSTKVQIAESESTATGQSDFELSSKSHYLSRIRCIISFLLVLVLISVTAYFLYGFRATSGDLQPDRESSVDQMSFDVNAILEVSSGNLNIAPVSFEKCDNLDGASLADDTICEETNNEKEGIALNSEETSYVIEEDNQPEAMHLKEHFVKERSETGIEFENIEVSYWDMLSSIIYLFCSICIGSLITISQFQSSSPGRTPDANYVGKLNIESAQSYRYQRIVEDPSYRYHLIK